MIGFHPHERQFLIPSDGGLFLLLLAPAEVTHQPGDLECVVEGGSQRMIAADEPVKLVVEDIADGRLEREPFLLGSSRVGPEDFFGHFEPGRTTLGEDLKPGLRQEPAGIAPGPAMIPAERDLGDCKRQGTWRRNFRSQDLDRRDRARR